MPNVKINSTDISDLMKQALEEMNNHLLTFYSQEDFLKKLDKVNASVRNNESDFATLKSQLLYMFEARKFPDKAIKKWVSTDKNNFDYEYFKKLIIELVPVKTNLIVTLLKEIYNIYTKFPPEQKFLARIVKRIARADKDKDFRDTDSLHMQILKRFVRHTNYHTQVIEKRVLESVSSAEKAKYKTLIDEQKKDFLIEHLTEDIFTPLDFKPEDYLVFFNGWVNTKNRLKYFTLTPFEYADEDTKTLVKLERLEREFVKYLSQYNFVEKKYKVVKDSTNTEELDSTDTEEPEVTETIEVVCRRDELYQKNKLDFIEEYGDIKNVDIFETLKNFKIATAQISAKDANKIPKGIGNLCDWTLQEYAAFLVALIKSKTLENNTWLSDDLHNKLVNLVVDLIKNDFEIKLEKNPKIKDKITADINKEIQAISINLPPVELLKRIIKCKALISQTADRIKLFEDIETAFRDLDVVHFEQFKKIYLIKNSAEKLGACGAQVEDFKKFLTEQIKFNKPIPYDLPDALTADSDTLTAYLNANNLTVDELHSMVVFYLKQIRVNQNDKPTSVGHIFDRAFKDKKKTWSYLDHTLMKIADDLATANFDNNGVNKKALYLFAFAFNMGFNTDTNTVAKERDIVQNLFQDFYTDNFLRSNNPPTGEGINFKNVVEVIYLYFLNKTDLTPAQKLDAAEKFIDDVFKKAKKEKATLNTLPMASSVYRTNFFKYLDKDETNFKQYLLDHYNIYSDDATESNNRIMLASEMRTVRRKFEELVKKIESYTLNNEKGFARQYPRLLAELIRLINNSDINLEVAATGLSIENLVNTLTEFNAQLNDTKLSNILEDKDFIAVLKKMETTLDVNERILKNKQAFFKNKRYTRSDLIALYHYYFCNFVVDNLIDNYDVTDWQELADEFFYCFMDENSKEQPGLNSYLDECSFSRFSPKILYDSFIIFFLYLEIAW